MTRKLRDQTGAAAVEFALVLPILLVLVFAVIDFGRMYFTQVTLTNAAREGVRVIALGGTAADATTRTQDAAGGVEGTVTVTTGTCTVGQPVTVTASVPFDYLTPLPDLAGFIGIDTITGKAVMRCGG